MFQYWTVTVQYRTTPQWVLVRAFVAFDFHCEQRKVAFKTCVMNLNDFKDFKAVKISQSGAGTFDRILSSDAQCEKKAIIIYITLSALLHHHEHFIIGMQFTTSTRLLFDTKFKYSSSAFISLNRLFRTDCLIQFSTSYKFGKISVSAIPQEKRDSSTTTEKDAVGIWIREFNIFGRSEW